MRKRLPAGGGAGNDSFPKQTVHFRNSVRSVNPARPIAPGIPADWFRRPITQLSDLVEAGITSAAQGGNPGIDLDLLDRARYRNFQVEQRHVRIVARARDFLLARVTERGVGVHPQSGRIRAVVSRIDVWRPLPGESIDDVLRLLLAADPGISVDRSKPASGELRDQVDLSNGTPRGPPLGRTFLRRRLAEAVEADDQGLIRRLQADLDLVLNGPGASFGGRG